MVMPNDQQLDDAIDRAVRELTNVDPPEGLRGRVFARLEEPTPRRPHGLLAGAAAFAAIVLLLVLPFRSARQEPARQIATFTPAPAAAPLAGGAASSTRPAPPAPVPHLDTPRRPLAARLNEQRRRARLAQEIVAANTIPELETGPEPLRPIPELGMQRIAPADIETVRVSVSPLASLQQLQVDPLPPPLSRK